MLEAEYDQLRIFPPPRRSQAARELVAASGYLSLDQLQPSTVSRPASTSVSIRQCVDLLRLKMTPITDSPLPRATDTRQLLIQTVIKHTRSTESLSPRGTLTLVYLHHLPMRSSFHIPTIQTPRGSPITTVTTAAVIIHEADTTAMAPTEPTTEVRDNPTSKLVS